MNQKWKVLRYKTVENLTLITNLFQNKSIFDKKKKKHHQIWQKKKNNNKNEKLTRKV